MKYSVAVFIVLSFGSVHTEEVLDSEYRRMPDLFGLDDYDSCLQEENGVYCVAKFELCADHDNGLLKIIKEHSQDTVKHFNYSYIDRGICITKTCKQYINNNNVEGTAEQAELLERCFNEILWNEYKINATIGDLYYCDRYDKHLKIDAVDWAMASLFTILVILSFLGSFYDVKIQRSSKTKDKAQGNKYLLCFSIFRNFQSLTRTQKDPNHESLIGLHGLRTVLTGVVVFSHTCLLTAVYNKDPQVNEMKYDIEAYYLIFNGMMLVQIFFFLSGFMLTYVLQIQSETFTIDWSMIPNIIIFRWIRLTPVCVVMIAFMASWARHLGSGPIWNLTFTVGPTAQCRTYWWSHLLYVNNMVTDNKLCLYQSWHIAADMQMFILGLIVHVATRNRGRSQVLLLLFVLGMLAPAVPVWLYGYDAYHLVTPEFSRALTGDTFYYMHNRGYMNLPCFLLGMATGYLGHGLQNRVVDLSKNMALRSLMWLIIPLFLAIIYSGRLFYSAELRGSVLARLGYAVTHRAAIGLLCSAWVLGLICRCNDVSRVLFTWRGGEVLSKLSYCVYIFHTFFINILLGLRKELTETSILNVCLLTLGVLIASYILAIPIYLMVETPFNKLIKTIWEERKIKEKKKN